jgi:hypothetical protein
MDNSNKKSIIEAVENELGIHPRATLIDLYKFFMQGYWGPGHLIRQRSKLIETIEDEYKQAGRFDVVLWQATGYEKKFFRINLSLVRDGRLTAQALADAVIESSQQSVQFHPQKWARDWVDILMVIEERGAALTNFEEDKRIIAERLAREKVLMHHSQQYRRLYHPHYRLVSRKNFEALSSVFPDDLSRSIDSNDYLLWPARERMNQQNFQENY